MSEETSTLSASEQAHIDSGGETPIVPEAETTTEVDKTGSETETEVVEERVQKVVPLAALHEERAKAKEMREKVKALEEQTRIGNERLQALIQSVQQRQQQPLPDVQEDPVGYFKAENEQLKAQLQEMGKSTQEIRQTIEQRENYTRLQNHVTSQFQAYAKTAPDLGQAVQHLQQADFQALVALGHSEEEAAQTVVRHHDELITNLAHQGVNIPERLHALAKARGYTSKAAPDGQEKLQATQKGVAAAKSLGSGGGVVNGLSLQALASMSPEEFAEATSGKNEAAWRKLMGG